VLGKGDAGKLDDGRLLVPFVFGGPVFVAGNGRQCHQHRRSVFFPNPASPSLGPVSLYGL